MPVVRLYYEDMERLIGASRETIMGRLAMMGADIGKRAEEEHVDVEFFPDRPDVLSVYTVRMTGDKVAFPVLLSNGNCI